MADNITAKDLAGKEDNSLIIDVREKDEIAEDGGATIEGAVNIPLGLLIRKARQGGLDNDLKGRSYALIAMEDTEAKSVLMNLTRKGLRVSPLMAGMQLGKRRRTRRIKNDTCP